MTPSLVSGQKLIFDILLFKWLQNGCAGTLELKNIYTATV